MMRSVRKKAGEEEELTKRLETNRTEAHARRMGASPPSAPHQEPMGPFASLPPTRNKLILRTPN